MNRPLARGILLGMSQENVEPVRRLFEAASDGDVGSLFQAADPDCLVYPRLDEPDAAREYRGLDGLMEYLTNWYGQWDEYESEPLEIIDAGEHVLVIARERGRVKRTGLEVVEDFWHSFVLRGGKFLEWHMYGSREEALEALGLSEQDVAGDTT
jgi:ketosteroid isomerase-like protein